MSNIAATPCSNCIHSNGGTICKYDLKTIIDDKEKMAAPGFCREFSTTQIARMPYGITAVIYFDQGDLLSDLIKTLMHLYRQNESAPIHARDEPLDQIKQFVIMDNTLECNKDLFATLQALGLPGLRLEQELESISFEKAIHYGITRYAKSDFTLALKAGYMFDYLFDICDFSGADRYVFMKIDESQGLYLNQGFRQLGGGERFLQRVSAFDNSEDDLIVNYRDLLDEWHKERQDSIDDLHKFLKVGKYEK